MKKIKFALLLLLLLSYFPLSFSFASNRIKELSAARPVPFVPPVVKPVRLSNGMICYLMEDHSVPAIEGLLIVRGGSVYDDIKRLGTSSIMMGLLKEGGTLKNSPEKVREILDENAIDIGFTAAAESLDGSFASLSRETDTTLRMFFEMLFEPAFDKEMMSVLKKRVIDGLKREMKLSGPISHRNFKEMVYGKENPWGAIPRISVIDSITTEDIRKYYDRFVSPDRMILAVSGDFNRAELLTKLEGYARLYPKRNVDDATPPAVQEEERAEERFIPKRFTQSAINVGHLGSTRDNPDKFALIVLNDILGGSNSFSNRLADIIRVKNGLAYEIWSSYQFGPKGAPGVFQIHAKTRNQSVTQAIELIKNEIVKIVEQGVTKEELKRSKDSILNNLIFEYERPFNVVASVARFAYFGYPENYIDIYRRGIEKVTIGDVNAAARKYLHPDKLKVVIVGQKR